MTIHPAAIYALICLVNVLSAATLLFQATENYTKFSYGERNWYMVLFSALVVTSLAAFFFMMFALPSGS